jgi:glycosyltransferase involved in cell wall biosynthesis
MNTQNKDIYFSVIIPCYNRSMIIKNTLNSLVSQTYTNFEVIVVDDYSSDNLIDVIKKYKETSIQNIKYIRNDKNLGVTYSRFNGLLKAEGNWIVLLDSDDTFFPDTLEIFKNKIIMHSDIDYFGAIWTNTALKRERKHEDIITRSIHEYSHFLKTNPSDYQGCYSKKSLEKVPFLTTKAPAGEFFHRLEYAKQFSCHFIGVPQGIIGEYQTPRLSFQIRKKTPWYTKLNTDEKKYFNSFFIHYSNNKNLLKMSGSIHYCMWTKGVIKLLLRNKNYLKSFSLLVSYFLYKIQLKGE